ncbi:MAG: hypothetical protein KI792_04380 [Alphaproteobacteria bacterium]|nr:hypothetical protein [Alphaproteobacteria bacterium SS10]
MRVILLLLFFGLGAGWFYYTNMVASAPTENSQTLSTLSTYSLHGPTADHYKTAGYWGDLAINETQLAYVIDTYGFQSTSVGIGDITVKLANGQVELDFIATGACQRQMQFMPMRNTAMSFIKNRGQEFFANAPQCLEEMPLREIRVRTESLLTSRFLQAAVIVPQINAERGIEPEDKVFDVVRKLGLPPNAGTAEIPNSIGGFSTFTSLNYPGVSVLFDGSYELVEQWHRYAGAATRTSELVSSLKDVPAESDGSDPVGELKNAVLGLLQDPDIQAGAEAVSEIEDRLSPDIVMFRVKGKPTPAMLEAFQNSPY